MILPSRLERDAAAAATLLGRTMMVLGGAYLLRALTESGRLPGPRGVVLGLAYAVTWFVAADRAGAVRPWSGVFHGLAAVLIGLPLLWEASTRFQLFTPDVSAAALALFTGAALGVAWHRRLQSLAAAAIAGLLIAVPLLVARTGAPIPFTIAMIALSILTLWLSDLSRWPWLRWPVALGTNVLLAGLIGRAAASPPFDSPAVVMVLDLVVLIVFGGALIWRTLVRGQLVRIFDVVHTALIFAVAYGGALWISSVHFPSLHLLLGASAALGAAGCYVAAIERVGRRPEVAANFHFFVAFGFLCAIAATRVVHGPPLVLSMLMASMTATWMGSRIHEPILSLHGALFAIAAAIGPLVFSARVWITSRGWPSLDALNAVVFAGLIGLLLVPPVMPLSRLVNQKPWTTRMARLIVTSIVVVAACSGAVVLAVRLVGASRVDPGMLATIRTGVLAAAAIGVASIGRVRRFSESGWLAYPILALTGAKLVVDDLAHSTAATLFVALAMYGAALILAPKIRPKATDVATTHEP